MNSSVCTHPDRAAAAATPSAPTTGAVGSQLPSIESAALLQGARAIQILHNGETYRLQTTRQGKLILTK